MLNWITAGYKDNETVLWSSYDSGKNKNKKRTPFYREILEIEVRFINLNIFVCGLEC